MDLSRKSYGPLVVGAALVALGLGAWRALIAPRLPERLTNVQDVVATFVDVPDADTALYLYGAPRAGGVLFVGDSRVSEGLLSSALAAHGLADAAILMGPMGQLRDLLKAARTLPMRRIVVGLSPVSVYAPPTPNLVASLAGERTRRRTDRIDGDLGGAFRLWKRELARPIDTRHWNTGWFERATSAASLAWYTELLGPETRDARSARLTALENELRALINDGWDVTCLRTPVGPALRDIEEDALPAARFTELCARLGVPFLDEWRADYATSDGSHLTPAEAARFSAALAPRLR
ncbi:MAG: hypothetical protein R3F49_13075 [Planctomycetota bacterium]